MIRPRLAILGRHGVDQKPDAIHQVIDISEIPLHDAMVIDVDGLTGQDRAGEFEMRHVGAAPRAIDGEEPEHGDRHSVEMGIGMRHRLVGLLGRRIERHLGVGLVGLGIGHLRVGAIDRGGRGHEEMCARGGADGFEKVESADEI